MSREDEDGACLAVSRIIKSEGQSSHQERKEVAWTNNLEVPCDDVWSSETDHKAETQWSMREREPCTVESIGSLTPCPSSGKAYTAAVNQAQYVSAEPEDWLRRMLEIRKSALT